MSDTPHLGLTYLEAAQAQKHVTVNEALRRLDAIVHLAVLDRDLSEPPGRPAEGARYLVPAGATGGFAGRAGQVAAFQDGGWTFLEPRPGWLAYLLDEALFVVRTATGWAELPASAATVPRLGILTAADAVNRLAVKADGVLFTHDDVTPGSGDLRLTLNRAAVAQDAALVFQTGYSSRAILGLLAGDDFTIKTSADGTSFRTALVAGQASGAIALPQSPKCSAAIDADQAVPADSWTRLLFNVVDHNEQGAFLPASSRFLAPFAGIYHVSAGLTFKGAAPAPAAMLGQIRRNGSALQRSTRAVTGLVSGRSSVTLCEDLSLAAADSIEIFVLFEGAAGLVDGDRTAFRVHHLP